jgi:hypothetical protein
MWSGDEMWTGCSLVASGGLLGTLAQGCSGHVVGDGVGLRADDLGESVGLAGVVRQGLGVDLGLRNGSWVVGYVPSADLRGGGGFEQLLTGEVHWEKCCLQG